MLPIVSSSKQAVSERDKTEERQTSDTSKGTLSVDVPRGYLSFFPYIAFLPRPAVNPSCILHHRF